MPGTNGVPKKVSSLLYTTMPAAPAAATLVALVRKSQVPRRTSATLPRTSVLAGSGSQASPVEATVPVRASGSVPLDGTGADPLPPM